MSGSDGNLRSCTVERFWKSFTLVNNGYFFKGLMKVVAVTGLDAPTILF